MKHILESANKDKLMGRVFFQKATTRSTKRKFSRSQTQHSASRVTIGELQGHTCCKCGLVLLGASDEVKKEVLQNVMTCISRLTTKAFVFKPEKPRGRTIGRSEGSQLYPQARDHCRSAVKKSYQ